VSTLRGAREGTYAAKLLLPVPDRDFDTTEVAVPWRLLTDRGHTVTFATEEGGSAPEYDPRLLHGVLVPARTLDPVTGRSVLADRRTTCLPKGMERAAYYATAWRLGRYYRTYPAYVEDEVRAVLAAPEQFERGPRSLSRGTATDHSEAFVVEDGSYVSARRPGDAYLFTERFDALLTQ
jgi:putative intracellular protease/amidase